MGTVFNKMCLSKTSYETKEEALASIKYLQKQYYDGEDIYLLDLKVYKCPLYQKYHLGSRK